MTMAEEVLTSGRPRRSMDSESARQQRIAELKARCMQFGVDASTEELVEAGLQLLEGQTETALEVAMLQSLRADRSLERRTRRR